MAESVARGAETMNEQDLYRCLGRKAMSVRITHETRNADNLDCSMRCETIEKMRKISISPPSQDFSNCARNRDPLQYFSWAANIFRRLLIESELWVGRSRQAAHFLHRRLGKWHCGTKREKFPNLLTPPHSGIFFGFKSPRGGRNDRQKKSNTEHKILSLRENNIKFAKNRYKTRVSELQVPEAGAKSVQIRRFINGQPAENKQRRCWADEK